LEDQVAKLYNYLLSAKPPMPAIYFNFIVYKPRGAYLI